MKLFYSVFCFVIVFSNIISVKMVPFPFFEILVPAGLFLYPITYLISHLVNELYGKDKAKKMVYFTLFFNFIFMCGLQVFGARLASLRILSSLIAFLAAQLVGIGCYSLIGRYTGSRFLWARNNGATLASLLVDTIVIDLLYLFWGKGLSLDIVSQVMFISFLYKTLFSFVTTPIFYYIENKKS